MLKGCTACSQSKCCNSALFMEDCRFYEDKTSLISKIKKAIKK